MLHRIVPTIVVATILLGGLMLASFETAHGEPLSRGGQASSVTRLPPDTDIAAQVAANENSNSKDVTYKIEGLRVTGEGNQRGTEVKLDLHEVSALDESTTYSVGRNGESKPVGRRGNHILVSDARKSDTVAIVSVNVESGRTSGIIQGSQGKPVTLRQDRGRMAEAREADDFSPPEWRCEGDHNIIHGEEGEGEEERDRNLFGRDDDEHIHHHHGEHHLNDSKGESFYNKSIGKGLRGSKPDLGRRLYLTDSYPQKYTYQVDMYIEIDQAFVDQHGSMEAAIDYVDILVSGANIIYEHEIDTHLHVTHIALTDLYDDATSTSNAINTMESTYGGNSWHFPGIDLHHALLANPLGGGIASLGALCDSWQGFGLSASLQGNFVSLDAATVWDMKVFAHELGHNFGSRHTHDSFGYSPVVDTCGTSCPSGLVTGSATLMSYCHQCAGYSSILYTFGGDWMGNDRSNMDNWRNNPELQGDINTDPKRVSMTMYEHASTRGSCLDPTHDVPLQICSVNEDCDDSVFCNGEETCDIASGTCVVGSPPVCVDNDACTYDLCSGASCYFPAVDCDDGNVCTDDSCDSNEGCKHQLLYDCCGNNICEENEDSTGCAADCGPFKLATTTCTSCYIRDGNMFDVEAVVDIEITSLTFRTYQGSGTVEVWTRPGSYNGYQIDAAGWTKIATKTFSGNSWAMVETPDFVPSVTMSAGSKQAFYVTHTDGSDLLYTGGYTVGTEVANDGRLKILAGRSANYQFGSGSTGNAWNGIINYSFQEEATDVPTKAPTTSSPTEGSTTSTPTRQPTTGPTEGSTTSTPTDEPTTSSPTTSSPTEGATTSSPTQGGTTSGPTDSPITSSPTQGGTTSTPTRQQTTEAPTPSPSNTPTLAPVASNPTGPTPPSPDPLTLTPDWAGGIIGEGVMFDVYAKESINVLSFNINQYTSIVNYEIWTKAGTCEGYQSNQGAWTLIGTAEAVQGNGYLQRTPLPSGTFSPVFIAEGATQAFYITVMSGQRVAYTNDGSKSLGQMASEDANVQILAGYAKQYPFSYSWYPRVANVDLTYALTNPPTNSPTVTPAPTTLSPTKAPSVYYPSSLKTVYSGPYVTYGYMFDVKALKEIQVTGMDVHPYGTSPINVEVWTRSSTYNNNYFNLDDGWTQVLPPTQVTPNGYGVATPLTSVAFSPVDVLAGETQAFYVTGDYQYSFRSSVGTAEGNVFASNGDMEILEGSLIGLFPLPGSPFYLYQPYGFNGEVYYGVKDTGSGATSTAKVGQNDKAEVVVPHPHDNGNDELLVVPDFEDDAGEGFVQEETDNGEPADYFDGEYQNEAEYHGRTEPHGYYGRTDGSGNAPDYQQAPDTGSDYQQAPDMGDGNGGDNARGTIGSIREQAPDMGAGGDNGNGRGSSYSRNEGDGNGGDNARGTIGSIREQAPDMGAGGDNGNGRGSSYSRNEGDGNGGDNARGTLGSIREQAPDKGDGSDNGSDNAKGTLGNIRG